MLLSGEHRKTLEGGQPLEIHNPSETYLINVWQKKHLWGLLITFITKDPIVLDM